MTLNSTIMNVVVVKKVLVPSEKPMAYADTPVFEVRLKSSDFSGQTTLVALSRTAALELISQLAKELANI